MEVTSKKQKRDKRDKRDINMLFSSSSFAGVEMPMVFASIATVFLTVKMMFVKTIRRGEYYDPKEDADKQDPASCRRRRDYNEGRVQEIFLLGSKYQSFTSRVMDAWLLVSCCLGISTFTMCVIDPNPCPGPLSTDVMKICGISTCLSFLASTLSNYLDYRFHFKSRLESLCGSLTASGKAFVYGCAGWFLWPFREPYLMAYEPGL